MHLIDEKHLLMIHPSGPPSREPVVDDLTRRMAGALGKTKRGDAYKGHHRCTGRGCEARSGSADLMVEGYVTNSLAVHYLAHHRDEVPRGELAKVACLGSELTEPTDEQLSGKRWR